MDKRIEINFVDVTLTIPRVNENEVYKTIIEELKAHEQFKLKSIEVLDV